MLGLKIFLLFTIAVVLMSVNKKSKRRSKKIAAFISVCCIMLLAVIVIKERQEKETTITEVEPKVEKIQIEQDVWGTITVTDDAGITKEYQGCIHISGVYPYETFEYMGLCVSMENAIEIGEWQPGMYKLYYEDKEKYWEIKDELEKENNTDE